MAQTIAYSKSADRETVYREITPQIETLVADEPDITSNLANIAAVLKEALGFFWVGFYLTKGDRLVLGPFQGPPACTRIAFGQGVCGHAYSTKEPVVVPDVEKFPGHIACSSASKSEIVLPIFCADAGVWGVLDADSDRPGDFSDVDRDGLQAIVHIIERFIRSHTNSERIE